MDDLVNYYLKSDTYTKSEVQQLISAVKQFTYQSVATLPTASADTMNIIYLVPSSDPQTQNVKDEYITIATTEQDVTTYSWEKIGSTDIDLSGYYTSQQTDSAINTALASYSTTTQMTTAINTAVSGKQNAITDGCLLDSSSRRSKGSHHHKFPADEEYAHYDKIQQCYLRSQFNA